jgi:hypothetical protein
MYEHKADVIKALARRAMRESDIRVHTPVNVFSALSFLCPVHYENVHDISTVLRKNTVKSFLDLMDTRHSDVTVAHLHEDDGEEPWPSCKCVGLVLLMHTHCGYTFCCVRHCQF